jgi:cell wall-associated NlpC family hydrolase
VGAAAFAAAPGLALAGTGAAPPAAESASAITILIPGEAPLTLAPDAKRLVLEGHSVAVYGASQMTAAGPGTDGLQGAQAGIRVMGGKLFEGAIRFHGLTASVQVTARANGSVSQSAGSAVARLVVLGAPVTDPSPGTQIPLGTWGTLTVDATAPTDGGLTGGKGSSTVALDVKLTSARHGLPAGTEIRIGAASAAITPAPQPAPPPAGRSGGSKKPAHHEHPSPKPARRKARKQPPAPAHRAEHRKHLPRRPIVTHPVTLTGGVRHRIVQAAESQIGWPYVWGGESEVEGGFDCSGLVDYAFAAAGHTLPGRPTAQVLWMMSQPIRRDMLEPGDLVFLLDRTGYAFHVGLYAGGGRVVVAAHHGAPVALQPLAATPWTAFGRLWDRRSAARPPMLVPLTRPHHQIAVAPRAAEPQATPSAAAPTPPAKAGGQSQRTAHGRHHRRRATTAAVAARDEDLGSAADRPPRGRSA